MSCKKAWDFHHNLKKTEANSNYSVSTYWGDGYYLMVKLRLELGRIGKNVRPFRANL
jgi:hypothetical protein